MLAETLETVISEYGPENALDQENILQEIMQKYILSALSRTTFFREALFHRGTCLRIVFGTRRFSEDLDFLLIRVNPNFTWDTYLERVREECAGEGINFEVKDSAGKETAVRKAFLKTDSVGKIVDIDFPFHRYEHRKIRIKLEIDTNPPEGSAFETRYLSFPVVSPITVQSPDSGFSLKIHALLCRSYTKGRDWYDFIWYVNRNVRPRMVLLKNALFQQGPWAGEEIAVDSSWLLGVLESRIKALDWVEVRRDLERFLPSTEKNSIMNWSEDYFLDRLRLFDHSMHENDEDSKK